MSAPSGMRVYWQDQPDIEITGGERDRLISAYAQAKATCRFDSEEEDAETIQACCLDKKTKKLFVIVFK
jgi:hypothetical protein